MRKISSVLSLILAVCLTIGGVSATWIYATGPIADVINNFTASMGEWNFKYIISFVNNGQELHRIEVESGKGYTITDADTAVAQAALNKQSGFEDQEIDYWMNVASTKIEYIEEGNTANVTLYPSFKNLFTATFVEQNGTMISWTTFTKDNFTKVENMAKSTVPDPANTPDDCSFGGEWEVREVTYLENGIEKIRRINLSEYNYANATGNISIFPIYDYNGLASLHPVDEDGDGDTDYYEVSGIELPDNYDQMTDEEKRMYVDVLIPESVNDLEIRGISENAFAGFDDLTDIYIPKEVTSIGANAFVDTAGGDYETVQIFYEGTMDEWLAIQKPTATRTGSFFNYTYTPGWDTYIGNGSVVVCSDGYFELDTGFFNRNYNKTWEEHRGETYREFGAH